MALLTESVSDDEKTRLAELIRRAEVSRDLRRTRALTLRQWYDMGSESGSRARYNKLFSHLNRVAAFLFAPGTVRFGVHLPPSVRDVWLSAASVARDEFRQVWEDTDADGVILLALEWSLVYGAQVMKLQADPATGFRLGLIQPWDFGVTREDVSALEEQDVCAHWYMLSVPQVERWVQGEKREDDFISLAREHAIPKRSGATTNRLVLSSVTGTFPSGQITGGFPGEPVGDQQLDALVEEPTVEFVDVWERRLFRRKERGQSGKGELFEDWLVTTILADANEPIAQRRNPDLPWTRISLTTEMPAEFPFTVLTPRPLPSYFWGRSELDHLTRLQDWLVDHLTSLKSVIDRQLDPPKFFAGVPDFEEAGRVLSTTGGAYGTAEPNSSMTPIIPQLTPEAMGLLQQINDMFSDISGVPGSIAEPANMPGGIRATGHFSMAAGIGAGRLRQMALVVEAALGTIATKAFHLLQRRSTDSYSRPDGPKFLLSQIPAGIRLSVNAHSAAPIFAEQTQAKATLLQKAGAIDGEDLVELFDMPNREELKAKARKLAESKAEMTREAFDIQHEKAQKGKSPLGTTKK